MSSTNQADAVLQSVSGRAHVEQPQQSARRWPIGAEVEPNGGVHFRVWAPKGQFVRVIGADCGNVICDLQRDSSGYFSGLVANARAGNLYFFQVDERGERIPDPASRFQPRGPHGPSMVVDSTQFAWTDQGWLGVSLPGRVLYELHVGTFTRDGTWAAACRELPELASLGIDLIELMPVAEFPGRFGWGYDGVDLFAPMHAYGTPDDMRQFVNTAHGLGIGVILDVVYNHLGPDGNFLNCFADDYFTERYDNEWGDALNFDGPNSGPVREFFLTNAAYWIDEFHLDGLRLDATQQMFDRTRPHIITEIVRHCRKTARGRNVVVIGENEPQDSSLLRQPHAGGCGLDAVWNDDFHRSAMVAMTGRNEAYYTDYHGTPQELISAVKRGFLYQGQRYKWQNKRRGTPALDIEPAAFVVFLQNHDQLANSARGERVDRLTSPGRLRAMTALLLLGPNTPLLFQGQEFAASSPFLYFADHKRELAAKVRAGRRKFLSQFRSLATADMAVLLPDPSEWTTFEACKLDFGERVTQAPLYRLHRDLLRLRRSDPVFSAQRAGGVDGAVLGLEAFVLRFFSAEHGDRLLIVNLGRGLHLDPAPEPLLAAPRNSSWQVLWSSEDPRYGGSGTASPESDDNWRFPSHAAVVLGPGQP